MVSHLVTPRTFSSAVALAEEEVGDKKRPFFIFGALGHVEEDVKRKEL
jgi:hypothetical protein